MAYANSFTFGNVTPKMVLERARELAFVKGRNPDDASESDLACAGRELRGRSVVVFSVRPPQSAKRTGPAAGGEAIASEAEGRDKS